jgi:hypothetical protein
MLKTKRSTRSDQHHVEVIDREPKRLELGAQGIWRQVHEHAEICVHIRKMIWLARQHYTTKFALNQVSVL